MPFDGSSVMQTETAKEAARALDLNNSKDARIYVYSWIKDQESLVSLTDASDDDFKKIAYQLFLFCDPRKPLGRMGVHH